MDYKNIKFRAWHKAKERMYNILELDFSGGLVLLDYYFGTTPYDVVQEIPFWEPVDEVELMMYTGQQDKHGKDIYEGDIVKSFNTADTVYWNEGCSSFYRQNKYEDESYPVETEYTKYREIIGNKYENPEFV